MLEGTGYTTRLNMDRLMQESRTISTRSGRATPSSDQLHRRRDRDLQEPDPRRHDLQHGEPAQAAGRRRPAEGSARGGPQASARTRAIRRWSRRPARSSARRPCFNVLMGRYKVLTGEFADLMLGLLRRDARPEESRSDRKAAASTPRRSRSRRARRTCSSRNGTNCAPRRWRSRAATASDEDVLTYAMFPQVAPKFFAYAARRPEERRQGAGRRPQPRCRREGGRPAAANDGKGPLTHPSPMT